ncbi:EpsG family protein [Ancylomarina sp. 16SWW S1-10-2]|uniref:EpsG family protein n=1 Tax=Ancylomarina sp. 16SWW S1-10-2 TaxID=2499681 RepID=UPI0012AD8A18|nr:EpsG family protein [Ancylomarina sp. 16SWW S1-10-2]MRT93457.1 EpsG family protein [Ancylomarina sp. 16SWW S1-10-2]
MALIPLEYYTFFYYQVGFILVLYTLYFTQANTGREIISIPGTQLGAGILCIATILYMGLRPFSGRYFVDMSTYGHMFEVVKGMPYELDGNVEWLFSWFNWTLAQYVEKETFFLLCAVIYTGALWLACKRLFKGYYFYAFVICLGAFSFWGYGVNGIRNGLSTSLLMLAFSFYDRKWFMFSLFFISVGIHKSTLLPIVAFCLGYLYHNTKNILIGWLVAIPLSLVAGIYFEILFANLGFDDRLTGYILNENSNSSFASSGFRWDFLLYSGIPVYMGYHYIFERGYRDKLYIQLFNTYLISNAFWILIIRASFSNRFAYLSWFMIPIILIYPLLKKTIWHRQYAKIGVVIFFHFLFSYLMFLRDFIND